MNNPLTWVVLLLALGGATTGYLNMNSTEEAVNVKVETETVEVAVDMLSERVEAAQSAAMPEIEELAEVEYQAALEAATAQKAAKIESERDRIRQEVTAEYIAELEEDLTISSY